MEFEIKYCMEDPYNHNYLLKDDYRFFKPSGSKPGVMYGLCKVDKTTSNDNNLPPFRPVLSGIGTYNCNLEKVFIPILKQFTTNKYTVKDSFSFCKEILDQDRNLFMASFDIQLLLTNIPLVETIGICAGIVFEKRKKVKGMLKRHFKQLLTLSVKSSCFLFDDNYYEQIDGLVMGSPLGPTLANLFLVYHERKWLESCPVQFRPKYYRRYVDDVFLCLSTKIM